MFWDQGIEWLKYFFFSDGSTPGCDTRHDDGGACRRSGTGTTLMNITVINVITISRFIAVLKQHIMNVPFSSGSAEHECGDWKHGCGGSLRGSRQHWGKTTSVICVTLSRFKD